jgi:hypothetical protein
MYYKIVSERETPTPDISADDDFDSWNKEQIERIENNKKSAIKIKAFSAFYIQNPHLDNDSQPIAEYKGASYNPTDQSIENQRRWVVHDHTLTGKVVLRGDGTHVFLPTSFESIITKYPYEFPSEQEGQSAEQLTGGLHYTGKIGQYDYTQNDFIYSKIPQDAVQIRGGSHLIREIYDVGVKQGIIPQPSVLYDDLVQSKLFSYNIHAYKGDSNSVLYHRALLPRRDAIDELPSGLVPNPKEREHMRLLNELASYAAKEKKSAGDKLTELAASMHTLIGAAPANKETVLEE